MKKLLKTTIIAAISAAVIASPLMVSAFSPVGNLDVAYATPKIDGTIGQDEWPEAGKLTINADNATAGGWVGEYPSENTIDTYWAWDDTNLYIAAVVTDPSVTYSESGDNYNGDAFQVSLNVGQVFTTDVYNRAIFYSWGLLEDGTVSVKRQESSEDGVIENVGVSSKTDTGWSFEIALPWSVLTDDVYQKADTKVDVAAGLKIDALVCYLDEDDTGTLVNAYGTSKTDTMGWDPDSFGITMNLTKAAETAAPETAAPETEAEAPATDTGTAAQTSDIAVVSAAVLLAAAGIAIVSIKRKK